MTRTRDLPVFPLAPGARSARGVSRRVPSPVRDRGRATGRWAPHRVVTLGCDKNTVDSERMMAALVGHGASVSSDVDGADVVIVNTCGFIQAAKEQSIETILDACALKASGEIEAVVAVGCMVQRHGEEMGPGDARGRPVPRPDRADDARARASPARLPRGGRAGGSTDGASPARALHGDAAHLLFEDQ